MTLCNSQRPSRSSLEKQINLGQQGLGHLVASPSQASPGAQEQGRETCSWVWSNTLPAQGWPSWMWVLVLGLSSQRGCRNYKPVILEFSTLLCSCLPKSLVSLHASFQHWVPVESDRSRCGDTTKIWHTPWCQLPLLCVCLLTHSGLPPHSSKIQCENGNFPKLTSMP